MSTLGLLYTVGLVLVLIFLATYGVWSTEDVVNYEEDQHDTH